MNGLMEELFETVSRGDPPPILRLRGSSSPVSLQFQDEMGISQLEDEGADDEDSNVEPLPDFNTPQAIR